MTAVDRVSKDVAAASRDLISPDDSLKATCEHISEIQRELTCLLDHQRKTTSAMAAMAMYEAIQRSRAKHEHGKPNIRSLHALSASRNTRP